MEESITILQQESKYLHAAIFRWHAERINDHFHKVLVSL